VSFTDAWTAAGDVDAERDDNTDPPEPGLYDVTLTGFKAFTSKSGNEVLVVDWRVAAGPQTGYEWTQLGGFKSEGQAKAAKSMCSRLGIPVADITGLEQLDQAGKTMVGNYYEVEIVQKGDFRNLYVQNRVHPGAPGTSDIPDAGGVPSQEELDEAKAQAEADDKPGW